MAGIDLLSALLKARLGENVPDPAQVAEGLQSDLDSWREHAIVLAGRDLLRFAPDLLLAFAAHPGNRESILDALRGDPLLRLPRRFPLPLGEPAPTSVLPSLRAWVSPARVAPILSALDVAAGVANITELLGQLPGLHQLAVEWDGPGIGSDLRKVLALSYEDALHKRFPAQVAIVPSWSCSRGCDFCFVADRDKSQTLDRRGFANLLDRLAHGGDLVRVNIFGGEPTELPHLADLANELRDRGLKFYFSTNALAEPGRFAAILELGNLESVTVHVDHPRCYSVSQAARLESNLKILAARRIHSVLRHSLVRESDGPWDFMDRYLCIVPDAPLSFAVAFPATGKSNRHVVFGDLPRMVPAILGLVAHVDRLSHDRPLVLAKPFPLCAFKSDELVSRLIARVDVRNVCELDRQGFRDQVLVAPDGTMSPCMALGDPAYSIHEPCHRDEAGRIFSKSLGELVRTPLGFDCGDCSWFECGLCQAACFAYSGVVSTVVSKEVCQG